MKNLLFSLFALLCCLAGCKKTEQTVDVRFAKVNFQSAGPLTYSVGYELKAYQIGDNISVPIGQTKFEIANRATGKKLLDTTLEVSKTQTYYIYQPDITIAPQLRTELPPPPPPPAGPLDGVSPSPAGFMQIKMANLMQLVLGSDKIDIEILSTPTTAGVYELIASVPGVTATPGKDFLLLKRPVRNGVPQANFKFRFLKSDTKEPIKAASGIIFLTSPQNISNTDFNAFVINFEYRVTPTTAGVEKDGLYYSLTSRILESK